MNSQGISKMRRAGAGAVLLCAVWLLTLDSAFAHTIRGHSTHGSRSGGSGGHGRGGYGFYGSYYSGHYGYGYYPYGYSSYGYYLPDIAYIDTDVSPEDAAVYLDGEYLGTVDDFDGFPRHLAVEPGRHRITFKAEGHKSVTRSVRVPRGAVLQIDLEMPEGTGSVESEVESEDADDEETETLTPDSEPGFVTLSITPPDASVYIDGALAGSASHFSRLHGEMRFQSGRHLIEVVRPGYRGITREVDVEPGDHLKLRFDLEPIDSGGESPR